MAIQDSWEKFYQEVVPPGTSYRQVVDMRKTFFAGAFALLSNMEEMAKLSDEDGSKAMDTIFEERADFMKEKDPA